MRNFAIHFEYPWLLLLLIPAFALTLVLYLMVNKRFRRTRNRIVSLVFHSIVMVLCICVLAGITFTYDVANLENEIILLVDVSDTEQRSAERRDQFVQSIVTESGYDGYKIGIVTFGFDQHYAVPLTYDTNSVYAAYKAAELPDTSATDIAAALRFVASQELFENPETAKIVLISDGKETDEEANAAIGAVARQGILVDTVYISSEFTEDRVQTVGVEYPAYHINQGEDFTLTVNLQCKQASPGTTVQVYDNGELAEGMQQTLDLSAGTQSIPFNTCFDTVGLHEIAVKISDANDSFVYNNDFSSYYFLEVFSHVLIIEHKGGESEALRSMLTDLDIYKDNVDILNLETETDIPQSVDDLRRYDQIILNNVSNADLRKLDAPEELDERDAKDWFVKMLNSYVSDYGGGLFTVGGKEGDGSDAKAHAYNRADLYNTLYQDMLPVQVIDYTPPVAVMFVIDISGSMMVEDGAGNTNLYYAQQGALECLEVLTERDYVGVMTLDSNYGVVLNPTSLTEVSRIREAIRNVGEGEATVFSDAIKTAGERLRQLQNVDKRHIVIVSDGMPSDNDKPEDYIPIAENFYKTSGITLSVIGIGIREGDNSAYKDMSALVAAAGGNLHPTDTGAGIMAEMREDLNAPQITEFKYQEFAPVVNDARSPLFHNVEYGMMGENKLQMDVTLSGFFGVKKRESAEVLLVGDYGVPIYAQWKYGKGMVGSFLCDLDGSASSWSTQFMADANGRQFLYNVIANLMPTEDLRPGEIRLELEEGNYINRVNVFTTLNEGQYIQGKILPASGGESEEGCSMNEDTGATAGVYVTDFLTEQNRFSRCDFVIKQSGIYKILIEKYNADGNLQATAEIYKAFSYSEEYDSFLDGQEMSGQETLGLLAENGNGMAVSEEEPWKVFDSFVTSLHRSFDPRLIFIIIAMVLFLGDIAVRKFKFKWIHELVREHRAKKAEKK